MKLALKVSNQLTAQLHRVLDKIYRHEELTGHDKKVMAQQLSVALLSLSTIRQQVNQGVINQSFYDELHQVSTLASRFEFFIEQLMPQEEKA